MNLAKERWIPLCIYIEKYLVSLGCPYKVLSTCTCTVPSTGTLQPESCTRVSVSKVLHVRSTSYYVLVCGYAGPSRRLPVTGTLLVLKLGYVVLEYLYLYCTSISKKYNYWYKIQVRRLSITRFWRNLQSTLFPFFGTMGADSVRVLLDIITQMLQVQVVLFWQSSLANRKI
jgi:hypothetical protein